MFMDVTKLTEKAYIFTLGYTVNCIRYDILKTHLYREYNMHEDEYKFFMQRVRVQKHPSTTVQLY